MTSKPKHLNIAALIFFLYDTAKQLVFPGVIFLIGFNGIVSRLLIDTFIAVFVVFMIIFTVWPYTKFTYQLLDDEIVIHSGIFVKKVNHVPYDRIQNVIANQWFFLKPFHLEELQIETAGHSNGAEVSLKAVPTSLRDQLNHLREANPIHKQPVDESETEVTDDQTPILNKYVISWRDLWKFATTSPAFLSGFLVVLSLYGKVQGSISQKFYQSLSKQMIHLGILIAVGVAILIILLFYLASVMFLIAQYYHFTLQESSGKFYTQRGFFKNRKSSINFDRIQAVMIKQPLLRSFLKISTVQLIVVSNYAKGDTENDNIVMPVITDAKLAAFLGKFFPDIPTELVPHFQPLRRTFFYYLRNALIYAVITIGLLSFMTFFSWKIWIGMAIVVLIFWLIPAYLSAKRTNVSLLNDEFLVIRRNHFMTRQSFFVPKSSIQLLEKRQSLWLEKRHMASLTVNIRAGNDKRAIKINYQAEAPIDEIVAWYKSNEK
ncbi:PH domain-containing protein [Companilactobacillus versmoldensis]|uniref:Membrane protein n=1 Tax=Companilactobacillus versmoldensis DSM 14857 = KCTC 3814 TaxID=1423815 RepID=A0A0R1SEH1_9LACO|nr:PH domain-containing protein [Companilactobacillus versmoldensis]KRL67081.1 membrane protein [Companilactobacillus versmoldensis DSM 14857 = KCTC 3814]